MESYGELFIGNNASLNIIGYFFVNYDSVPVGYGSAILENTYFNSVYFIIGIWFTTFIDYFYI